MNQDLQGLAQGVAAGNRRSLARALTLVESAREADRAAAEELLAQLGSQRRRAVCIGITGSPGVGKSTLIEQLGLRLVDSGRRVGVLAIDPTSSRTGGSILGDKTRMAELSRKAGVFIRPSPTGSGSGALSASTRQTIAVLACGPFDFLLLETAGAGQADTDVADLVDLLVLVLAPGGGDELQGMKRGVRELADLIVVNKADGELSKLANSTAADYARSIPAAQRGEMVVCCSALEGTGVSELAEKIVGLAESRVQGAAAGSASVAVEGANTGARESSPPSAADAKPPSRAEPGERAPAQRRTASGDLGRLNHVALATPDLEKATAFYRDVLGAKVSAPKALPEHGVTTVFVRLPNSALELLEPLGEDSPVAAFLRRKPEGGMHHICCEVDDILAARDRLRERGVRILGDGEPRIGAHGLPVLFLHPKDCFGVLVELEQSSA